MGTSLEIGTAKIDVTPPFTVPYLGRDPRHQYFTGVHDPLYARAAVIGNDRDRVAVIAVDSIGYSDILLDGASVSHELGRRVQQRTGIPADHVLLSATHAHSTPETTCIGPFEEIPAATQWFDGHLETLASLVAAADASKRTCRLKAGSMRCEGIAWNRRIEARDGRLYRWDTRPEDSEIVDWGVNDHELSVWLFEDARDGRPLCVFANFACHPTTVQVQPLVSADFPGRAMGLVESELGCTALFLQGMCGNVRPVSTEYGFEDVERHGVALGGAVLYTVGRLMQRDVPALGSAIAVSKRRLAYPARTDAPVLPESEDAGTALELSGHKSVREARAFLEREHRRMELIARRWPQVDVEAWACRIGEGAIVGISGEPFVEFGLHLKASSPARHTLTLGYTGGYVGYLPDAKAYRQGGYEVSYGPWTRLEAGSGERITEFAAQMLQSLWSQERSSPLTT